MSRRGLIAAACAALVVIVSVVVTRRPSAVDTSVGAVTRVGIASGGDVEAYRRRAASSLRTVQGASSYALVSLSAYVDTAAVVSLARDVTVVRVFARVPIPRRQTRIEIIPVTTLPTDVDSGFARAAEERERAAVIDQRAATGVNRLFLLRNADVERREAAGFRSGCACVFAMVVRASPGGLRSLASRAGIRVVEPAPDVARLDRTVFLPLLPEQTVRAAPPPDDGLPVPSSP